jgi:hypothetical protein
MNVLRGGVAKMKAFPAQTLALYADYNKSNSIKHYLATSSLDHRSPVYTSTSVPRSESIHMIRTAESLYTAGPTALLSMLPMVGYPLLALALLAPQYTLSHHFWTREEERAYQREACERMDGYQRDVRGRLVSAGDGCGARGCGGRRLDEMSAECIRNLAGANGVLHSLSPLLHVVPTAVHKRLLLEKAAVLLSDTRLLGVGNGVDALSEVELREACCRRGLGVEKGEESMRRELKRYARALEEARTGRGGGRRDEVAFVLELASVLEGFAEGDKKVNKKV